MIALFFAVHAVRSGQDRYWLFILFVFPLLGSVVYAIAIWLPEMRYSHGGRQLVQGVRNVARSRPRAARSAGCVRHRGHAPTTACGSPTRWSEAGRPAEAVPALPRARCAASMPTTPTPRYAWRRRCSNRDSQRQARQLLDGLIQRRPEFRSPAGHLIYARAVAERRRPRQGAANEFDTLVGYFSGFEARARYAEALDGWGERVAALGVRENARNQSRVFPRIRAA